MDRRTSKLITRAFEKLLYRQWVNESWEWVITMDHNLIKCYL